MVRNCLGCPADEEAQQEGKGTSYQDIRGRGLHYMQTGKPLVTDDPQRVVSEGPIEMANDRLMVLLCLRAALLATAAETEEMVHRGFLDANGRVTVHGRAKLAALREATVTVVP